MFIPITYLAHVGEEHITTIESAEHLLESTPYAIGILLVALGVTLLIVRKVLSLNLPMQIIILALVCLLLGLYLHDKHNAVAASALSLGFLLILVQVVTGLSPPKPATHKKRVE